MSRYSRELVINLKLLKGKNLSSFTMRKSSQMRIYIHVL